MEITANRSVASDLTIRVNPQDNAHPILTVNYWKGSYDS